MQFFSTKASNRRPARWFGRIGSFLVAFSELPSRTQKDFDLFKNSLRRIVQEIVEFGIGWSPLKLVECHGLITEGFDLRGGIATIGTISATRPCGERCTNYRYHQPKSGARSNGSRSVHELPIHFV